MSENESLVSSSSDQSFDNEEYGSITRTIASKSIETNFRNEFKIIGRSSLPLILTMLLQYSMTTVTILSVGHIGENELAGVSLANVTFMVTSSIFVGMATCLDTLCPQAFGAKKLHLVGLYWQRNATLCFIIAIPVITSYWLSGSLLKHIVPNEELAMLAQQYLRIISFGLPGYIIFETGKRFLQAQGIFTAGQYILFICAPLNALLNYLFVFKFKFGFVGAPIAVVMNYWFMSLLLIGYILFIDGRQCWYGFKLNQCFQNWMPMISLALPGIIMIEAEFVAFQIVTLSCSYLGVVELASQSIVSTLASLSFQIPFSISIASSTRIANLIGSGSKKGSQTSINVAMSYSIFAGLWNFSVIFLFKDQIPKIFTNDPSVYFKASEILPIVAINQIYDSFNVLGAGCLRAQGRQKIGGNLSLFAYYLIGLPLGLALCFKYNLKVQGLWIGLGVGIFVLAMSEIYYVYTTDWDKVLNDSKTRHKQADVALKTSDDSCV